MKKAILLLTILVTTFLSSCTVYKTKTSKTMDIYGSGVIQFPVVVDLDVKEIKVTGTSSGSQSSSFEALKHDAVADALKNANADVLIEPKFESETTNGRTHVTVKGWPATYKNFRQIKDTNEVKLLEAGIIQKAEVYQPQEKIKKKSNAGLVVLMVLVLFGLLIPLAGSSN